MFGKGKTSKTLETQNPEVEHAKITWSPNGKSDSDGVTVRFALFAPRMDAGHSVWVQVVSADLLLSSLTSTSPGKARCDGIIQRLKQSKANFFFCGCFDVEIRRLRWQTLEAKCLLLKLKSHAQNFRSSTSMSSWIGVKLKIAVRLPCDFVNLSDGKPVCSEKSNRKMTLDGGDAGTKFVLKASEPTNL